MPLLIFLLFALVPIVEIGIFIEVGGLIGLWPTIAIVILTAAAGTVLLRSQGLAVLRKAQEDLNAGRMPVAQLYHGLLLFFAGALLLTPGFLTDTIGLLLFVPALRAWIGKSLFERLLRTGRFTVRTYGGRPGGESGRPGPGGGPTRGAGSGPVIEGEFETVDDARPEDTDRRPSERDGGGTWRPPEDGRDG
jgi:UPF0716 protein FxsA